MYDNHHECENHTEFMDYTILCALGSLNFLMAIGIGVNLLLSASFRWENWESKRVSGMLVRIDKWPRQVRALGLFTSILVHFLACSISSCLWETLKVGVTAFMFLLPNAEINGFVIFWNQLLGKDGGSDISFWSILTMSSTDCVHFTGVLPPLIYLYVQLSAQM